MWAVEWRYALLEFVWYSLLRPFPRGEANGRLALCSTRAVSGAYMSPRALLAHAEAFLEQPRPRQCQWLIEHTATIAESVLALPPDTGQSRRHSEASSSIS